ncbi:MAG: DUF3413 domain-containing protein [Chitinophagaceae bacterium]|nr:DUF3413 domain-containing protein [Oligoflexus sp.]
MRQAFIVNLGFALLIALRYLSTPTSTPSGPEAWAFALTNWFGQFAVLSMIAYTLIMPFFMLVRSQKFQQILFVLLTTFIQLLLLLDTFVYEQFRFHINFLVFEMFLKGHGQVIAVDNYSLSILLFSAIAIGAIECFVLGKIWNKTLIPEGRPKFSLSSGKVLALGFGIFTLSQVIYSLADFYQYRPVVRLGLVFPLSEPLKMKNFYASLGLIPKESVASSQEKLNLEDNSELNYPLSPIRCQKRSKLNVLWIVVDTLRSDMVTSEIMPIAYALSQTAQSFHHHMSGSNSTRHGISSMFYGIPGTYFESLRASQTAPILMDEFRRQSYEMGIFASAPLTMPEFDQTVFSHIPGLKTLSRSETDYGRDQEVTEEFHRFLDHHDKTRPFFSFLFFDALHQSNMPPDYPKLFEPARDRSSHLDLSAADPTPYFNRYKNSAHFVDTKIGQVLSELKKSGLDATTVVLLTADHGEEFNDNHLNYWGHNSNYSDAQVHVPMVIRWPRKGHNDLEHLTSHYDLAPTFMKHVLGCASQPDAYSSGKDLFLKQDFEWIVEGTSDNYAVIRKNDVTTVKFGSMSEVTDHHLKALETEPDPAMLQQVFHEMRRFYKSH